MREPAPKRRRLISQFLDLEAETADDEDDEEGYEGAEGEQEQEFQEDDDDDEEVDGMFANVADRTMYQTEP
jgi:hypothetical protein